jgi:hypothetical protein
MVYIWNPWQHETDNPRLLAHRLMMPNRLDPTIVTDLIWAWHEDITKERAFMHPHLSSV